MACSPHRLDHPERVDASGGESLGSWSADPEKLFSVSSCGSVYSNAELIR